MKIKYLRLKDSGVPEAKLKEFSMIPNYVKKQLEKDFVWVKTDNYNDALLYASYWVVRRLVDDNAYLIIYNGEYIDIQKPLAIVFRKEIEPEYIYRKDFELPTLIATRYLDKYSLGSKHLYNYLIENYTIIGGDDEEDNE